MKKTTRHVTSSVVRNIIAPCILFAAAEPSFGVIIGSYVVNADQSVTYSYQIDNSTGTFDVSAWSLEFAFASPDWNQLDAPAGGVTVPSLDWVAFSGTPITGLSAQDFLSLSPSGDVLVHGALSGFSFTSAFLPGPISYHEFSADGKSAGGQTIGPAFAAAAVPDGNNGLFDAIVLSSIVALGAGRKIQQPATV
jgi:hypothetical protein